MDYGLFGVRFLFLDMKMERCSIDELLIYFATPPLSVCIVSCLLARRHKFQYLCRHFLKAASSGAYASRSGNHSIKDSFPSEYHIFQTRNALDIHLHVASMAARYPVSITICCPGWRLYSTTCPSNSEKGGSLSRKSLHDESFSSE